MSKPEVSIIMPAYNGEQYIAESIISVINQTYQDWELIVVDDGSADRTREVAFDLKKRESRIKYLYQKNGGQGKARNRGMRQSQGDFIAFLDQDDLWLPDKLELQIKVANDTDADVIFSNSYIFHDGSAFDEMMAFPTVSGRFCGKEMLDLLFIQNRIPILTALVKKTSVEQVGFINDDEIIKNCDDYDLWLRLAERGATFFGMPDKLARYRVHPNQASKNEIKSLKSEAAVLERHYHKVGVGEKEKRQRFHDVYQKLASSLVKGDRIDEAIKVLFCQLSREGFKFITLFQILVLKTTPSKYHSITTLMQRLQASASYRIVRPINNLRQMLSQ